jgi:hypothetical protein
MNARRIQTAEPHIQPSPAETLVEVMGLEPTTSTLPRCWTGLFRQPRPELPVVQLVPLIDSLLPEP